MNSRQLRGYFVFGLFLGIFGGALQAGHVIGIDFVSAPVYNPLISLFVLDNFFPYEITAPTSPFAADGALAGISETEVQRRIVDSVQRSFRRAEIDMPGRMLHVDIRDRAVTPEVGTTHLIGGSFGPTTLFGSAYATGAVFRPDLRPNTIYTNALSLTFVDSISTIPQLDPTLRFRTLENVVESIAGTTSHEIAHTLNVWNHDPGTPFGGIYSLLGTGSTGLPLRARLDERRFLDIPNTQYEFPGPPPGGALIYSVTDTLLRASGTTWVSDFNFDGQINVTDRSIWENARFQEETGVKRGDANDDALTDVRDLGILSAQQRGFAWDPILPTQELLAYDPLSGEITLDSRGLGVESLFLSGPGALSLGVPYSGANGMDWEVAYFADAQQWYGRQPMFDGAAVVLGQWQPGLGGSDFGLVELGTVASGRVRTSVRMVPEPTFSPLILALLGLLYGGLVRRDRGGPGGRAGRIC
jgi:hypothetical protein